MFCCIIILLVILMYSIPCIILIKVANDSDKLAKKYKCSRCGAQCLGVFLHGNVLSTYACGSELLFNDPGFIQSEICKENSK